MKNKLLIILSLCLLVGCSGTSGSSDKKEKTAKKSSKIPRAGAVKEKITIEEEIEIDYDEDDEEYETYLKTKREERARREEEEKLAKIPRFEIQYNTRLFTNSRLSIRDKKLNLNNKDILEVARIYTRVIRKSKYCCTYGITREMSLANINDSLIKTFLYIDKEQEDEQSYCAINPMENIMQSLPNNFEFYRMFQNIKNSCVCTNNLEDFKKDVAEYKAVLDRTEELADNEIMITYDDEFNRRVKRSITNDMKNLEREINRCR